MLQPCSPTASNLDFLLFCIYSNTHTQKKVVIFISTNGLDSFILDIEHPKYHLNHLSLNEFLTKKGTKSAHLVDGLAKAGVIAQRLHHLSSIFSSFSYSYKPRYRYIFVNSLLNHLSDLYDI